MDEDNTSHVLTPRGWWFGLSLCINDAVRAKVGRSWNEDLITESILSRLTHDFAAVELLGPDGGPRATPYRMAWDAFKLSGTMEHAHGDIAILVKQTFANGRYLVGVAFLEAKRLYRDSQQFNGLDRSQLERQLGASSAHRLLLYDWNPVDLEVEETLALQMQEAGQDATEMAVCLPTAVALGVQDADRDLYPYALPLSYVLTTRYLQGMELDTHPPTVGGPSEFIEKRGGVKFLCVADVSHTMDYRPEPNTKLSSELANRYERLSYDAGTQKAVQKPPRSGGDQSMGGMS